MNKQKNRLLLAAAESADDKQTGYGSDESIAEGELVSPVQGNDHLCDEHTNNDNVLRRDHTRPGNFQDSQNKS